MHIGLPQVDVAATWDADRGRVALFLVNRSLDEAADVEVALRGWAAVRPTRAEVLTVPDGDDRFASNSQQAQNRVELVPLPDVTTTDAGVSVRLPAMAWAVVEVEVTPA